MSATCKSCGASIRWVTTEAGKPMPVDDRPHRDGNLVLDGDRARVIKPDEVVEGHRRYKSHFATCANASKHRKPKEKRT